MKISKILRLIPVIIIVDQFTKFLAEVSNFRVFYNKGIAFGFFAGNNTAVQIYAFVWFVLLIIIGFVLLKKPKPFILSLGLVLLLSGGLGNLIDRFFRKSGVVDFIRLGSLPFPVFNLADVAITFGFILIFYYTFYDDAKNNF